MQRIRLSSNFWLDEFVAPEIYKKFQGNSLWFIHPSLAEIAQTLRNEFGAIIINNWTMQGKCDAETFLEMEENKRQHYYTESGVRTPKTQTGAGFSQHKFGNALDLKFIKATPEEVRRHIIQNYQSVYRKLGLRAMEAKTNSWLHIDCRNTDRNQLIIFNP